MEHSDRAMARQLAERVAQAGGRVYFVGGCVRDALLGKPVSDLDVEVHGIAPARLEEILDSLGQRLAMGEEFPHEIGLFLSYPLEDVEGFIENGGKNSKCTGCWKVYCNEKEAERRFSQFDKCARVYRQLWAQGRPLEKLTVAV